MSNWTYDSPCPKSPDGRHNWTALTTADIDLTVPEDFQPVTIHREERTCTWCQRMERFP